MGAYRIKMNVQAHVSGQISGQVPNQAGAQLPGLPPQNGSSLSNHIQNLGGQRNTLNMNPELVTARRFMQEKIYDFLMQRQQQPHDIPPKRVLDIVRRLDEGLFGNAVTKEEYVNLETLENRLRVFIKRLPMSNHNQQYPHLVNASSPIGTMIPTPGMPRSGNSSMMVASSVDTNMIATTGGNSMASVTVNTGSLLPTAHGSSVRIHGGSFNSSDGTWSKRRKIGQKSEFSIGRNFRLGGPITRSIESVSKRAPPPASLLY